MPSASPSIRSSRIALTGVFLSSLLLVATCDFKSDNDLSGVVHYSGEEFAGVSTCGECHASITEEHTHTPHYLTSTTARAETIKGSFHPDSNALMLGERIKVLMEKTDSGFVQRGIIDGKEVDAKPMDVVIGSGRKGQTYLYWHDNELFQLPASYYAASKEWSNSPGYAPDQLVFNRSIPARCLECHSTFFKAGKAIAGRETFDPNQVMLGVTCERCHGPAGDHVIFHLENPGEKEARYVINPARLTRQQRLDNCALCHSGLRENILPSFSYVVGEDIREYSYAVTQADSGATLEVHGNQYGLLLQSKCFKGSEMDCSSCHDVHAKESRKLKAFSARCMNCHEKGSAHFCRQEPIAGLVLEENCIDCHMPVLPSRQVFLQSARDAKVMPFFVRTHLIDTYPEKVELFLEQMKE